MNSETHAFSEVLRQLQEGLEGMLDLLEAEAECLKTRDVAELERIAQEKQVLAGDLNGLSARQGEALRAQGLAPDHDGMEAFLSRSVQPEAESMRDQWLEIVHLTTACKRQNEINGAYIDLLGHYVETSLDILHGPSSEGGTYGPDGSKRRGRVSRRSFSV
jgi:flagellar biosynthesis/type III secretory pathway chaperone